MRWQDKAFIGLQHLTPQHALSRGAGWLANNHIGWIKNTFIRWFVKTYDVDMSEAVEPDPTAYYSFNDFFTRAMRADARPIAAGEHTVVCPTDGTMSQLGDITDGRIFQAKGHDYSLLELMGGKRRLAEPFMNGRFATLYLSPSNYHRVHIPFSGTLKTMVHVPGKLFSVNKVTASGVPRLFARNERVVCVFDTPAGPMGVVLVGAMIVASIATVWAGQITPPPRSVHIQQYDKAQRVSLDKGAEMGRFYLGSTVIVLFGPDRVTWNNSLSADSPLYMGQPLGQVNPI